MKSTSLLFCLLAAACSLWSAEVIQYSPQGMSYAATTRSVNASGSLLTTDHTILANAASGVLRLDLPGIRDRWQVLTVKKIDTSSNAVVLKTLDGKTIDGFTNYCLSIPLQVVELQMTDNGWRMLSPASGVLRKVILGTPRDDETNRAVTTVSMKVGAYTIANQPDLPRNVTVTHTAVSTVDTLGTIVIVGTDYAGAALTETLTPSSGVLVAGTKAFRTITSITGVGWIAGAGADSVILGYGALIGLPVALTASSGTVLGTLDTVVAVKATTGSGVLATSTVAEASGDAAKVLTVYLDR